VLTINNHPRIKSLIPQIAKKGVVIVDGIGDRKRLLLQAIVDDYIKNAEPVGSRTIVKRYELGLSSATIRNEMADLEDMGFLDKPHTSAGRIPSHLGYRYYVNSLMQRYHLSQTEIERLSSELEIQAHELKQILSTIADVVSRATNYAAVVIEPTSSDCVINDIKLVVIDSHSLLLVVVTSDGLIKSRVIKSDIPVNESIANYMTNFLCEKLKGLSRDSVTLSTLSNMHNEFPQYHELIMLIFKFLDECLKESRNEQLYLSGTINVLNYPEYNDIDKAKAFLALFDKKDILKKALEQDNNAKGVSVFIGVENNQEELKEYSLILSPYKAGEKLRGKVAIIGPTRMHYSKAIVSLEYICGKINQLFEKLF